MGLPHLRRDERKLQTVGRVTTAWCGGGVSPSQPNSNDGVSPLKAQNSKPQANTVPSKKPCLHLLTARLFSHYYCSCSCFFRKDFSYDIFFHAKRFHNRRADGGLPDVFSFCVLLTGQNQQQYGRRLRGFLFVLCFLWTEISCPIVSIRGSKSMVLQPIHKTHP